jgi:prepilin-type N-terminal cleavage/methylation domain-containing protein
LSGRYNAPVTAASSTLRSGFSLLEVLVALTLLGVALLFSMSLIAQEPQIERRLAAHAEVLEVLDALHEAIRAGMSLPLEPERLDWQELYDPPFELRAARNLTVWSEVESLRPEGLYRVTLKARYSVGPVSFDRTLETMIWRPR